MVAPPVLERMEPSPVLTVAAAGVFRFPGSPQFVSTGSGKHNVWSLSGRLQLGSSLKECFGWSTNRVAELSQNLNMHEHKQPEMFSFWFSFCWRWVETCTWLGSIEKSPHYFRHANSLMCFTVLSYWDVEPFKFTLAPLSEVCVIKVKSISRKLRSARPWKYAWLLEMANSSFALCTLCPTVYFLCGFVLYTTLSPKTNWNFLE